MFSLRRSSPRNHHRLRLTFQPAENENEQTHSQASPTTHVINAFDSILINMFIEYFNDGC